MIDMASVYAERFKGNPRMLQAAVMGQSPDPKLDPYTALNALRLIKESSMMAMAGKAQQPTSQPSILAETLAPPAPPQGLAGMMPMGAPAGQMPQQRPMPQPQQAPVQQASGGLAGMSLPDHDYAGGGIVAFAKGELVEADAALTVPPDTPFDPNETGAYLTDGTADQSALQRAYAAQKAYSEFEPAEMSAADSDALYEKYMRRMKAAGGPDIHGDAQGRLKAREEARAGDRRQGEGLALLTAAGKILKGHTLAMGASEALPAFAQQMGEVHRADIQEQRAIEQMNFALADAQRKERMGDARGAQAAVETARKFQQDANKAKGDKLRYQADIAARTVQYSKATGKGAGAGGGPKLNEQLYADNVEYLKSTSKPKEGESPEAFNARIRAQAGALTAQQVKTSFSTGEIGAEKANVARLPVQEKIDATVSAAMKPFALNSAYRAALREAKRTGDDTEAKRLWKAEEDKQRAIFLKSEAAAGGGGGSSRSKNPTAGTNTKIKLDKDGNILP